MISFVLTREALHYRKKNTECYQTSAEIETHEKDVPYVEIEAIRHCIKLLESRNVVVLTGREGSGKSRNGLEILRQFKERHKDSDVFKLIGLNYVSDIVKCNVTSIVLFDDAFDKICEQFANDKHILDHLYSYITLNKVKLIFTMRNTVRHACNRLLSTHRLFYDLLDIDLNSKRFKLTKKVVDKTNQSVFHEAGIDNKETIQTVSDQVSVFVNREMIDEIIQTDPFLGFPECCRLFTEHRNNTMLDVTIFKCPSHTLVKDIEKWKIEGKHDSVNGLKYVALICILSREKSHDINEYYLGSNFKTVYSLHEKNIDVKVCNEIFQEYCNKNSEVYEHDIKYALDELVAGCYLVKKDGTYYFQHPALKDAVLVSYGKINTKAIIPLLSFDHMMDLVKLQNYSEQENEIFVRIDKKYYHDLAIHFISLVCHTYCVGLIECSTFAKHDIDFIHQLLLCFNDKSETSLMLKSCDNEVSHYFPLCLLQNIGELDDNKLTANHTQDHLLITMVIEGQTITFIVDPFESLQLAFQDDNERIIIWLAKNTNHSLLKLENLLYEYISETVLGSIPLLLQNFDNDQFDMTDLLLHVCIDCFNKENHIIDWMIENINNSLIDYDDMFENDRFSEIFDLEKYFNLILHIRNKVNSKLFDVSKAVKMWCIYMGTEIVQRVLQDGDNKILDEEELIDILIDDDVIKESTCTTGVKYYDLNKLVCVASKRGWLNVLELIFKHYADKSFHTDKVIEDALQQLGNGQHCEKTIRLIKFYVDYIDVNILMEKAINFGCHSIVEELLLLKKVDNISYHLDMTLEKFMSQRQSCYDKVIEDVLQQLGNGTHCEKTIRHIMKYYVDYIDVNILMEKAVDVGCHSVVEELLLKTVDNISYLLDITLDKLRHQQLSHGFKIFERGHGKILLLLLQKNNTKLVELNSKMNDLCQIGHSPAIQWLLENKPSFSFDIRKVMNNACFRGDLELVDYLFQKYSAVDFDYKTAMIKACRHAQCNTLDVCKWLWKNIDHVDTELYDIDAAVFSASEHGNEDTLQLLLNQSGINMLDIQSALTLSCRNERSCLRNAKLLYRRANKSNLDMNAVLLGACKYYRTDFIQWIIETCDKNITVFETSDGHKNFIKSFDKHRVDMDQAVTFILDMDDPEQKKDHVNETKKQLLMLIINQSDPNIIHIYTLLAETCKNDWIEIFQLILEKVDHARLNIGEIINVACRFGAFKIIKWSIENIDMQLVDADNVMVESCGFGWLECMVLIWKHCGQYKLQEAMTEACTYGQLHIAEWLLQNVHCRLFNIPMLLQEAGRNGWANIFGWLLQNFHFDKSDMHIATSHALENGHLEIAELGITKIDKEGFDFSSLSENVYAGANKEAVVNFLLHNIDHRSIDIDTIMTNACLFGWKDIATFIVDNDLSSRCDLSLAFNIACENGELEIVELLLENVDPYILTTVDKAMHSIAVKGWDEIALLLLAKVKHTRLDIGNALIEACRHGEIDVVQAILRKVNNNLLDVKAALNKACENHMHEELVLWMLENIDQEQVDLKTVKTQAIRHKWRKVQFSIQDVDNNEIVQEIETDNIIIIE
ncbi:unnamed protein product [Mytilus edulis]|uniref:Novel STAND NTPase 3 domain-containing protein n=1 Tax=Mytilus edulis TaxID=6550 RepID=A0A8S3RIW9_MYTED|nr:unnamed protein product [Mytilus edulis]